MQQILGYLLSRKIAEGSSAELYEGSAVDDRQKVVIKILHSRHTHDKREHQRLANEYALALRLDRTEGIVRMYKFGHVGALPYIVMECIPGKSLGGLVRDRKQLTNSEALRVAGVLGRAIRQIHVEGIYHSDIKSDNVMYGGNDVVKLIDFGIAKTFRSVQLSIFGRTLEGSPAYLAPELIRSKKPTPASDLYALGCTLYEAVTGRLPYAAEGAQAILQKQLDMSVKADPIPFYNKGISHHTADLIMKAIEKDVKNRYKSADEFLLELARNPHSSQYRSSAVAAVEKPKAQGVQNG